MTVGEIVRRVRSAIDELVEQNPDFAFTDEDRKNLDQIIIDKIEYALQYVIENAPIEKLDGNMLETLTQTELESFTIDASSLVASVRVPDDMLRLVEARLSSWSLSPIPESPYSQVYLMQQDQYARGSWDRPVSILTHHGRYRYLEMYCAKATTDTLNFVLVRKPVVPSIPSEGYKDIDISVPVRLTASLIYQVAGLTMVAFREEIATSLFAIARRHLYNEDTNEEPV